MLSFTFQMYVYILLNIYIYYFPQHKIKRTDVWLQVSKRCFLFKPVNETFWKVLFVRNLTILTGKDWCFTQLSTGMAGWLLMILFICLHDQLSSIHPIVSTDV